MKRRCYSIIMSKPKNPKEPDLEELLKRAEPFL